MDVLILMSGNLKNLSLKKQHGIESFDEDLQQKIPGRSALSSTKLARLPTDGFAIELKKFGFPPFCRSSYRALASTLVGCTFPLNETLFVWSHMAQRIK